MQLVQPSPALVGYDGERGDEERPEVKAAVFAEDDEDEEEELNRIVPGDCRESQQRPANIRIGDVVGLLPGIVRSHLDLEPRAVDRLCREENR